MDTATVQRIHNYRNAIHNLRNNNIYHQISQDRMILQFIIY